MQRKVKMVVEERNRATIEIFKEVSLLHEWKHRSGRENIGAYYLRTCSERSSLTYKKNLRWNKKWSLLPK